jgi:adenylate cyclase
MRIHSGYEVKTEGDAFVVAFQSPIDAIKFCSDVQSQFVENEWPREILESPVCATIYGSHGQVLYRGLSIRMGIHFGAADDEEDKVARRMDYYGIHVIIAARISALADGGEINITSSVLEFYQEQKEFLDVELFDLGLKNLKGLPNPEHLYVLYPKQLAERHQSRRESIMSDKTMHRLRLLSIAEEVYDGGDRK